MTAWWNVYPSKDKKDMIWADMTWVYIVIYDIWNFAYTYNCLPTHSWFCGIALSFLMLGERLTPLFLVATALMAAGCWLATKSDGGT